MPCLSDGFEEAHEQSTALLAEVAVGAGVLHDRKVARDAVDRLGEQVVVLGGLQRHVDAGRRGELPGPQAGREHHRLALDVALVGDDARDLAPSAYEPGDGHAGDHGGTTVFGALGQCGGHAHRIGAALVGHVGREEHIVSAQQWEQIGDLACRDELVGYAEPDLEVALPRDGLDMSLVARDVQVADRAESRRVTRLLLEARIQVTRVARHPERRLGVIARAGDEAGRVPGRPRRQLVLLEQDDVTDSELREVVGDRGADDAAADDDHLSPRGQGTGHVASSDQRIL